MVKVFSTLSLGQRIFLKIFIAVFLILFFRFFVISNIFITTENMNPNLKKGDFVLGWHLSYGLPLPFTGGRRLKPVFPRRGDLISFRFPGDKEQLIIRRVIALPGDRLSIRKGLLFLNDKRVAYRASLEDQSLEKLPGEEDFHTIKSDPEMDLDILSVPKDHVFVLSDHRKSHDDSSDWGFVLFRNIESHLGFIWLSVDGQRNLVWSRFFLWVR